MYYCVFSGWQVTSEMDMMGWHLSARQVSQLSVLSVSTWEVPLALQKVICSLCLDIG